MSHAMVTVDPLNLLTTRKKSRFELGQIGNVDEVSLTFSFLSNKAVSIKGAKLITIKTSDRQKTHFTFVLACCAGGTKLPPLLIIKVMPSDKIPQEMFNHIHAKGWMDENGMKLWLEKVWSKRSGGFLKKTTFSV
jgi:hypothetical protein